MIAARAALGRPRERPLVQRPQPAVPRQSHHLPRDRASGERGHEYPRAAARLCALVPPPGFHMTRYFGVFANRHHLRPRSIPSAAPMPGQQLALGLADSANLKPGDDTPSSPGPRRLGWPLRQAGLKSTRTRPSARARTGGHEVSAGNFSTDPSTDAAKSPRIEDGLEPRRWAGARETRPTGPVGPVKGVRGPNMRGRHEGAQAGEEPVRRHVGVGGPAAPGALKRTRPRPSAHADACSRSGHWWSCSAS